MIIYNVTYCVEPDVLKEWDIFTNNILLTEYTDNQYINDVSMFRILQSDSGALPTFCFHLEMSNLNDLRLFKNNDEGKLQGLVSNYFGNKCLFFSTVLKHIELPD